jgi:hypothetical protein
MTVELVFFGRVIVGYFSTLRAPLSEFPAGKPMISLGLCRIDFLNFLFRFCQKRSLDIFRLGAY